MAKATTKLNVYWDRRDFRKSLEPRGREPEGSEPKGNKSNGNAPRGTVEDQTGGDGPSIKPAEQLRFVIQKHDATRLHYDLRLELDGVFKSWAVTRGPSLDPAQKRLAVEVEDHPLEYGDFEGTIPEGEYGGGTVMLWDRGFWAPEGAETPESALSRGELKLALAGGKLHGSWVLVRLKRRTGENHDNWLLIKHRDEWSTPGRDDILDKDKSIASGRHMEAIAAGRGKPPERFMTDGAASPRSAVWDAQTSTRARRRSTAARVESRATSPVEMPRLTNPDRQLWPEPPTTKAELARYLVEVAPWMITHMQGRPCSLLRAPDGITAETFFQRHAMAGMPGTTKTVRADEKHAPYLQFDDAQSIVDMAQISAVEFHPWNCAPFEPRVPGRFVFDLDPAPDVQFDAVIGAARELRERLTALGLVAFCKTTGGKGLHVVVPLDSRRPASWDQAKLFAHTLSAQIAGDSPDRYVTKMSKRARRGRIFIDYLRNDFSATTVAPLSPRARPGAFVSMPLNWPQVRSGLDPKRFDLRTAAALLAKSNAWPDYEQAARPLAPAIDALLRGRK